MPVSTFKPLTAALAFLAGSLAWMASLHFILAGIFADPAEAVLWQAFSPLAPVAVGTALLYRTLRRQAKPSTDPGALPRTLARADAEGRGGYWAPAAIFLGVALLIVAAGLALYHHDLKENRATQARQLESIIEFKRQQIESWLKDRQRDSLTWSQGSLFGDGVAQWLAGNGADAQLERRIEQRIWHIKESFGYVGVALLDREGQVRLAVGKRPADPSRTATLARSAIASGAAQFSDLYLSGNAPEPAAVLLDFVAPIRALGEKHPTAALAFSVDPGQFLFPLIQSWPLPSATAESLLVRRESDRVLYLNELRHRHGTALRLSYPLEAPSLTAALAARGTYGAVEGVDYRSIPVLAYAVPIAGTPWRLLAKIDQAETAAPVRRSALLVTGAALLCMLASGGTLGLWARHRRLRLSAAYYQAQAERNALSAHLDYLARYANDIILLTAPGERIIECNDRALAAYGYSRQELLGLSWQDLAPPEWRKEAGQRFAEVYREGSVRFEACQWAKGGEPFAVEVSARLIDLGEIPYVQSIIRDISEQKRAQAKLARLSALREALSRCNRAILHAENRNALLAEACRAAVRDGRFEAACVYGAEAGGEAPTSLAAWGHPLSAQLEPGTDVRDGGQEALRALRENGLVLEDARQETFLLTGLAEAPLRGFGAYAAIPLADGQAFQGALLLFAARSEKGFQGEVRQFLSDMAADISLGLRFLRQREQLRLNEERLSSILESVDAVIWSAEPHTFRLSYVNTCAARTTGYSAEALLARPTLWLDMIVPEDRERIAAELAKTMDTGLLDTDFRIQRPDGSLRWINDRGKTIYGPERRPLRLEGVAVDITERRVNGIVSEAIQLISTAFLFKNESPELFGRAAWFLAENLRFPIAAIGLYDPVAERIDCLGFTGAPGEDQARPLPALASIAGPVAADGAFWCEPDIANLADPRLAGLAEMGGRAFMCLPLRAGDQVMGSLLLADRHGRPDVDALAGPMRLVAHHLALEINRRRTGGILDYQARTLRSLIDGLHVFVGITTPEGVIVDANRAALSTAGLDLVDVIGQPFDETYWWSYAPEAQERIRAAIAQAAQGETVRYTDKIQVAGGRLITVDIAITPVHDQEGRVTHLIPSGVDITQRSEAEAGLRRDLQRFQLCFDSNPVALALFDPCTGRCFKANRALETALGYAPGELAGLSLAEITRNESGFEDWARLARRDIESLAQRWPCTDKGGLALEVDLQLKLARCADGSSADTVLASFHFAALDPKDNKDN